MARPPRRDGSRVPGWIEPMLAKPDGGRLCEGPEWVYEYKLDGYRACMQIAPDGTTRLTSRNGIDFTAEFGDLAGVLGTGPEGRAAVLDGEIVVYNEAGQPEFGLLQERRGRYQTHSSIRRAEAFHDLPVRFLAFDLGYDIARFRDPWHNMWWLFAPAKPDQPAENWDEGDLWDRIDWLPHWYLQPSRARE